ncbi:phage tail-collar fiber domain-containing protein [Vibrio parahaemolyticus]|uniref:phage tail-collar fiber domain-containing protein n=1 Tax=Vibrio parahaemolyticus TaxID=670 RepID=UPI00223EA488|nr:phage tail protein [Vibrio parahaemolyticus]MDL1992990.1 phage tail protein [Vibrio parahaemolyticus]
MSAKYYTILTETGKSKIANAAALGRQVKLTHLAVGDGNGSEYDPVESQTELRKENYRSPISNLGTDAQNPNWVVAEGLVPVDVGSWFVREVGLFDEDGDLFAIGKYPETYKPTLAEGTGRDLYIRFIMVVSNTDTIDMKIDPTVAIATKNWVKGYITGVSLTKFGLNEAGILAARDHYENTGEKTYIPVTESDIEFNQDFGYDLRHLYGPGVIKWNGKPFRPGNTIDDVVSIGECTAKAASGQALKIACYGDSTTDGYPTTGHTNNTVIADPTWGKIPVGDNNHSEEAPNAWPTKLRSVLRDYHSNSNIEVFNGGYGGTSAHAPKSWANRWFEKAFLDNPHYGMPDVCLISFGLNDAVTSDSNRYKNFLEGIERLVFKCLGYGVLPVLLSTDPVPNRSYAKKSQEELNAVLKSWCERERVPFVDIQKEAQCFWSVTDDYKWFSHVKDNVHHDDPYHGFKAGLITRSFANNLVCLKDDQVSLSLADQRFHLGDGSISKSLTDDELRFGGICSYDKNHRFLGEAWVWVDSSNYDLVMRDFGMDYSSQSTSSDQLMKIEIESASDYGRYYIEKYHGHGGIEQFYFPASESPSIIGRMQYGLNKIKVHGFSPEIITGPYVGYLQFIRDFSNQSLKLYQLTDSIAGDVRAQPHKYWNHIPAIDGVSPVYQFSAENWIERNIVSFSNAGEKVTAFISLKMSNETGYCLIDGNTQSGRSGIALYRGGQSGDTLRLYEYHYNGAMQLRELGSKLSALNGDVFDFRVEFISSDDGTYTTISVFIGYDSETPAITVSTQGEERSWRTSGTIGGIWTGLGDPTTPVFVEQMMCTIKNH